MLHLGTSGFADPPLANVIVRYTYTYIYICRDKHVNTLAGVSSKHKQTSCWNETNSLSHHLLSLQKAMFQFHYPNDLIHIGQFSKLIDFLHTVYMLHTCCILRQTVQPLGVWQFRAIQLHGLVGGPQVDVGWLCLLRLSARFLSNSHPEGNSDF